MSIREQWVRFHRLTIDNEASKDITFWKVACDSYLMRLAIELKLELAVQSLLEVIHNIEKSVRLHVLDVVLLQNERNLSQIYLPYDRTSMIFCDLFNLEYLKVFSAHGGH